MTALALAGVISAATLSTIVTLGRSGAAAVGYLTMDQQTASALQWFARDARMASAITWNSATSVTLTVPDNYTASANQVTYGWDNTNGSPTYRCFYRMQGTGGSRTVLARWITSFAFARYDRRDAPTTHDDETKRLEISLSVGASVPTVQAASDQVSASFILRNKPLS